MKYLMLISALLTVSICCHAQSNVDTIVYGKVDRLPMMHADCITTARRFECHWPFLTFRSKIDSVFCNVDGTVAGVVPLDNNDDTVLLVKDKLGKFYSFVTLRKTPLIKGQSVKTGDFLGLATDNNDDGIFECTMTVTDKNGIEYDEQQICKFLNVQVNKCVLKG
jgi:hypothetical protein